MVDELDLPDADRRVLKFACDQAERLHTTRPAMPWRAVAEGTGLGQRTVRNSLRRLDEAGLLALAVHGLPAGPSSKRRRANCYRLPAGEGAHIPVPKVRSVGPPDANTSDRSVGPPPFPATGSKDTLTINGVERIADDDGYLWPVTGYQCEVCGWPLDQIHADIGTHPTCDVATPTPRQRLCRQTTSLLRQQRYSGHVSNGWHGPRNRGRPHGPRTLHEADRLQLGANAGTGPPERRSRQASTSRINRPCQRLWQRQSAGTFRLRGNLSLATTHFCGRLLLPTRHHHRR
jgi:hypothetical protein